MVRSFPVLTLICEISTFVFAHAAREEEERLLIYPLPDSLVAQMVKESACNVGDQGSIPGSGRSPGEGNGTPLQYSCLEKSMGRGAWQATVHGVTKSRTQLSDSHFHFPLW